MAQGSKPRHSRSTRKPVTIDLEPGAVSAQKADQETAGTGNKGEAGVSGSADTAKKTASKTSGTTGKTVAAASSADGDTTKSGQTHKTTGDEETKAQSAKAKSVPNSKPSTDAPSGSATTSGAAAGKSPIKDDGVKASKASSGSGATTQGSGSGDGGSGGSGTGGSDSSGRKSGGGLGSLGTGLAGGVVAIALYAGLQWGGVLPNIGGQNSATSVSGDLSAQLDTLKQTVAKLETSAGSSANAIDKDARTRLDALEKSAGTSDGGQSTAALTALESKVAELTSKVATISSGAADDVSSAVSSKLTAIESAQTTQQTLTTSLQTGLTQLSNTIAADEKKQDQLVAELQTRLASIEKTLDGPRQDIKVAKAIAAASLKAAIDRGGSFMAELEAFASVDGDSGAVSQLRTFAASGVPSRAKLLNEFPAAANAMINADGGVTSDTGFFDRLVDSASSLVKVRPVGEVAGDSVQAIVARMESQLKNGNLQGAMDEWKTLPQASQSASAQFEKDLQARIQVEKLVSGTLNAALPSDVTSPTAAAADATTAPVTTGTSDTSGQTKTTETGSAN